MPLSPARIITPSTNDGSTIERIAHRQRTKVPITIVEYNPLWPQQFLDTKARIEEIFASHSPVSTVTNSSTSNGISNGSNGSSNNSNKAPSPYVILAIEHAGSTSVPGLPAKDIIDIDLVVRDIMDEESYVGPLESLGFRFLFREPGWYQHRFFVDEGDCDDQIQTQQRRHSDIQSDKTTTTTTTTTTAAAAEECSTQEKPLSQFQSQPHTPINLHVFGPDCPEVERHRIFRDWLRKTPEDLKLYADIKRESAAAVEAAGESLLEYTMRKGSVIKEILDRAFRELGYVG